MTAVLGVSLAVFLLWWTALILGKRCEKRMREYLREYLRDNENDN